MSCTLYLGSQELVHFVRVTWHFFIRLVYLTISILRSIYLLLLNLSKGIAQDPQICCDYHIREIDFRQEYI